MSGEITDDDLEELIEEAAKESRDPWKPLAAARMEVREQ